MNNKHAFPEMDAWLQAGNQEEDFPSERAQSGPDPGWTAHLAAVEQIVANTTRFPWNEPVTQRR
jgi:hypothetical protein